MKRIALLIAIVCQPWYAMATNDEQIKHWPDLPLLSIVTKDSAEMQNNIISAPEGCIGITTDNEYVGASMIMTFKGDTLLNTGNYVPDESGMRIRIRGNSTGANNVQHPYKLKLTKKADLISPQNPVAPDKEWVLLNAIAWNPAFTNEKSGILNWVGNALSRAIGMEWTPRTTFVNVMVNGKYEGVYTLTESVERDAQRIDIHKSGFIIENDIYFWKDEKIFKTEHQLPFMGYTFKYPDTDKINDERIKDIAEFMNEFEDKLYKKQEISEYIDYSSFARWILAHDILGSIDGGGTNMFVTKDRFDSDNPLEGGPMKMCVLWDFESVFRCEPKAFASCHLYDFFYYHKLFERADFCTTYQNIYDEVRPKLMEKFVNELQKMVDTYSEAYEESMAMHNQIYPEQKIPPLSQQVKEAVALLKSRLTNLDEMIPKLTAVDKVEMENDNRPVAVYDLNGLRHSVDELPQLPRGVYLIRYANGQVVRKLAGK